MTTQFATGLTSREHRGGACPTHPDAIVRVKLRGPAAWGRFEYAARQLRWKHRNDAGDIVRYAVVSAPKEEEE